MEEEENLSVKEWVRERERGVMLWPYGIGLDLQKCVLYKQTSKERKREKKKQRGEDNY